MVGSFPVAAAAASSAPAPPPSAASLSSAAPRVADASVSSSAAVSSPQAPPNSSRTAQRRAAVGASPVSSPSDAWTSEKEALWDAMVRNSQSSDSSPVRPPSALVGQMYDLVIDGTLDPNDEDASSDDEVVVYGLHSSATSTSNTGLFDDSDDEEPRRKRSRLRRGDETSVRNPPLPDPPERHPSNHRCNFYDPTRKWDYKMKAGIVRLLDVHGDVPHRCYLVQWKGSPLQMSWNWEEDLDDQSIRPMMRRVDEWKAAGTDMPFTVWNGGIRDTASAAGTCFMDAFRAALYYLGAPNLVSMKVWDDFEDTREAAIVFGVSREDASDFFKLLQRESVPLNYELLFPSVLEGSVANVETFEIVCEGLDPGVYLVSAGQDDIDHCFVVVATGINNNCAVILDSYKEEGNPPVVVRPLRNYAWIEQVKWMSRVELNPGYVCRRGKRLTSTEKKKKLDRLLQQKQQQQGM